jgi:hypothetical protein
MAVREQFTIAIKCSHCGQPGAVMWEENSLGHRRDGLQRALMNVSPGFHAENGRTQSGDPLIVCDTCDTIQAD